MNELIKKIETMRITVMKLNEYYDNNLKFHSVSQMAGTLKEMESKLEGKANGLELKKIVPRIHEIQEKMDSKDSKMDEITDLIKNLDL
jgi:hypothetical protein